ncbi:MAG TPA: hypothetical protein VFB84_17780 [Micromonosporaceae bacterium]|nr:hypothetical protein [Micromonosporaceae bacterium]
MTQVAENDAAFTAPLTVLAAGGAQVGHAWVELLTKQYAALGDDPPIITI